MNRSFTMSVNMSVLHHSNTTLQSSPSKSFFELYFANFMLAVLLGGIICLFAVVSNIICLVAILKHPPLKKRGNILIANLVIVNILLALTVHPVTLVAILKRQYQPLPKNFCDWIVYYYYVISCFAWHECLLAINRLIAIIFPHQYKVIAAKHGITTTILAGYIIAFVINSYPLFLPFHIFAQAPPTGACLFDRTYKGVFPVLQAALGVYTPIVIVGMSYTLIFAMTWLRKHKFIWTSKVRDDQLRLSDVTQAKRMRLAKMLFCGFMWNAVTYLPHPLLTYFVPQMYTRYPSSFFHVRTFLQLGAAGNPIVFALLHPDFRTGMLAVVRCWTAKTTGASSNGTTNSRHLEMHTSQRISPSV